MPKRFLRTEPPYPLPAWPHLQGVAYTCPSKPGRNKKAAGGRNTRPLNGLNLQSVLLVGMSLLGPRLGLARLHRLLLGCVSIRQLLRLLLVLLLDLLCPGVVSLLLCQALMVRILLLLEPLAFLVLPRNQGLLLLLVLLVSLGISGVCRLGALVWSKVLWMDNASGLVAL